MSDTTASRNRERIADSLADIKALDHPKCRTVRDHILRLFESLEDETSCANFWGDYGEYLFAVRDGTSDNWGVDGELVGQFSENRQDAEVIYCTQTHVLYRGQGGFEEAEHWAIASWADLKVEFGE